jgi:hypothetical protein
MVMSPYDVVRARIYGLLEHQEERTRDPDDLWTWINQVFEIGKGFHQEGFEDETTLWGTKTTRDAGGIKDTIREPSVVGLP